MTLAAAVVLGLHVAGERELVAGIDALGGFEIDDAQVGRPLVGAEADGIDRNQRIGGGGGGDLVRRCRRCCRRR